MDSENIRPNTTGNSTEIHGKIADVIAKMGVCVRNVGLYGRLHTVVEEASDAAGQALSEIVAVQSVVTIAIADSRIVMDSFPIEDGTGCLNSFAKLLGERGVGELRLTSDISRDELIEFSEALSMSVEDLVLRGGMAMELQRRNITNIQIKSGSAPAEARQGKDPADIYEEAILLVEEAMRAVQSGLKIPVAEIRSVVSDSLQCLISDESALLALAGIRSYDRYLSEHSVNVCILSMVLGRDLGLDSPAALELGLAALLHDVGKVFVPPDVVKKPGKLTEEEWLQMRKHPAEGARALAGISDLPALASTIALEHHVHCDGSGYPAISGRQSAHLLSRLVAIVDTYDALTTDRPYRERWTAEQAIGFMLYEASRQYDRQLLARFASRANLYPLGSLVQLKRGDFAIVIGGSHNHPTRPTLKIISAGSSVGSGSKIVDLSTNTDPGLEIDTMAQPVEVLLPYTEKLAA